jgi:hypothetical protein
MVMRLAFAGILLIAAVARCQTLPPDVARLVTLKDRASALLANIPNYTCLETVGRVERGEAGRYSDVIRVAVAVVNEKETYGWPKGDHFLDRELSQMIRSGLNATGLYGTFARGLMSRKNDDFQFAGEGKLNGESVFRYDFQIPAVEGPWNIRVGKESGRAGERGSFWVEAKSLELRRLEVGAILIPLNVGLTNLHLIIDYEVMMISDRRVLLPATAWVDAREESGKEDLSHVFFNHCRSFGADSAISFASDGHTGSQAKSRSRKFELPAGLEIAATLRTPVDSATAAPGDALEAAITKPVFWKGKEIVSQGARLEGHIRQLRPLSGSEQCAVTVEFDRIETFDGWVQFYGRMTALTGVPGLGNRTFKKKGHPAFEAAPDVSDKRDTMDPEIPGISTIFLSASSAHMPAGTSMTWRTEDLSSADAHGSPDLKTHMPN